MTQQTAQRWLVELLAEPASLEDLSGWFPDGDAYVIKEGDSYFLVGPRLVLFDNPNRVREEAVDIIDGFAAVALLLEQHFERPALGRVWSEDSAGKRSQHAFAVGAEFLVRTDLLGPADTSRPTKAQRLLNGSRSHPRLSEAAMVWADPVRTWPRLYRVLEEIELFLGMTVDKARLCSKNERERFTRSANSSQVAGRDARHADDGNRQPPAKPMRLPEATVFIKNHLMHALALADAKDRSSAAQ